MQQITLTPINKEYFTQLLSLYSILFQICKDLGCSPIVYGSLAYIFYTKDENIPINDIDLLVPEELFSQIIEKIILKQDLTYQTTNYNSLKIFHNDVKISFDSIKHYCSELGDQSIEANINGVDLMIINIDSLKHMYQRGRDTIAHKEQEYNNKLQHLLLMK